MGLTIAYSLLASLAVAVTVVPSLAATVLGKIKEEKESGFFVKLGNRDEKILDTQTSHIKNGIRTLINQYFSSQISLPTVA